MAHDPPFYDAAARPGGQSAPPLESVFGIPIREFKTLMSRGARGDMQLARCIRCYDRLLLQRTLILSKAAEAIDRLRIEKTA